MTSSAPSSAAATFSSSSSSSTSTSSSSSSMTGWTHRTEERAAQNMARNRDMLECQAQLRHWKKRWNSTKQQFKQASLGASLRADPQRWNSLPKRAKWDKTNVLIVFQHYNDHDNGSNSSCFLPAQLQEDSFATAAPATIVNDKDVFLARIATRHCQDTYTDLGRVVEHRNGPRISLVPKNLRDDPDVIRRLLELYACYFAWQVMVQKDEADWIVPGNKLWNDPQLFGIFLSHLQVGMLIGPTKDAALQQVVAPFAWSIRNDPDVVMEVLRSVVSSRGDLVLYKCLLQLLLGACRPTPPQEGKEQQQQQAVSSPPPLLKNNKAFALRLIAAQDLPDLLESTLKLFSKRLRDDDQVVLAMVRQQGMALRYASFRLRRNREVILAAFEQDPMSLVWAIANSSGRRALERQRDCMLLLFEKLQVSAENQQRFTVQEELRYLVQSNDPHSAYRRVWKRLAANLQSDPAVARAALVAGCVDASELPVSMRTSREFWYRTIQTSPYAYDDLPVHWQNDVEFLRALPSYPRRDIWDRVRTCPELAHDREVWLKLTNSDRLAWYVTLLQNEVPPTILNDKELMILACSVRSEVYHYLEKPLNEDRDILEAALNQSPDLLSEIPDWLQLRYPELVAKAIHQWDNREDMWDLFGWVHEDLWLNPLVARAWVSRGGDYLHEEFDDDMEDDKELFLLIAQHNPQDFWCASERLCNDKEFMMQAVGKNPTLLCEASRSLLHNFDVALVAFGGGDDADESSAAALRSRDLPGSFDINDREDFEFITDFAAKVRERLATHEIFVTVVMCGMSASKSELRRDLEEELRAAEVSLNEAVASNIAAGVQSFVSERSLTMTTAPSNTSKHGQRKSTDSHFRTLNQGSETSMAYRILLAEFMGVPIGRELRRLRRASVNLAAWGY